MVALWFHTATLATSSLPLAVGWPQRGVLPAGGDAALLLGVAACSFLGQLLITRGMQVLSAAKASAINFMQVRALGGICSKV